MIRVGADADFCVWDPDRAASVEPARLYQRHKTTPYAGRMLSGTVAATLVRGASVWDGTGHLEDPVGEPL